MNDPQNPYPYQAPQIPTAAPQNPAVPVSPVEVPQENRRTGKIARFPKRVRDTINELILDGVTYAGIIEELGARGKGLNAQNLSNWHAGGYKDWLKEQKRRDDMY